MHFIFPFGLALLTLPFSIVAQQDVCWGVDGKQWTGNKRCPNSSACCGENATCMPNRLCRNKGQDENQFVRGPCAVAPYDEKKCAAICVYDERNNRFPRVLKCNDGSYCCDFDEGCCNAGRGTFLDRDGNITDNSTETSDETSSAPSETAIRSSATLDASTTADSTTASSEASASETTGPSAETADDSQVLKIGLGVGIPAAALIAALAAWLCIRRKRATQKTSQDNTTPHVDKSIYGDHTDTYHSPPTHRVYHEMETRDESKAPRIQELQG